MKVYSTEVKIEGRFDDIRPGMSSKVEIVVKRLGNVIAVPVQCVVTRGGKKLSYIKQDGKVQAVEVVAGASNDSFVEIKNGIKEGDEVLVQAYTCVVVSNAIIWTGAKPVYVDVGDDFNINLEDLKNKITEKTKVLIIQHTFGLSVEMDEILQIARENNLKVIEDCAHSFGAKYKENFLGTFGDIGMFSFGSDKIISCVRGGALITSDPKLKKNITELYTNLPELKITKIIQHLFHYPFFYFGKMLYGLYIGKIILWVGKKFKIMNKIIEQPEKKGEKVDYFPAKLPNALAAILEKQLSETIFINKHRQKIAHFYNDNLDNKKIELPFKNVSSDCVYLRYPILVTDKNKLSLFAKKQGILLGDWYNAPVAPKDIDIQKTGYVSGSCTKAEKLSLGSLNLPTNRHVSLKDAKRVVDVINNF